MSIGRIALILFGLVHWGMVHAQQGNAAGIRGAGATLPAAIYTSWGQSFAKEKSVPVTYQAVGSGDGVKRIIAREVDFGASDAAVSREEIKRNNLFQFPTVIGGIVPVVSFRPGSSGQLRLTGPVLADIFAGRITEWNDTRIAELNPGATCPRWPSPASCAKTIREPPPPSRATFRWSVKTGHVRSGAATPCRGQGR